MLGGFEVSVGDRHLADSELSRRDSVRLLQYLALIPGRRAHREQVLDALWPDVPFETVANRLHKAAHYLRKGTAVSGSVVLASDSVSLFPNAAVDVDVEHFERLARTAVDPDTRSDQRAALADEAIRLYQGDLLPHDPYEEWTFHHRQRLQLRYRDLLRQRGRYVELLAVDPVDEEAHVGLMRTLLASGDRSGVRRQYQVLSEMLERELGVSPSAEARAVVEAAVDAEDAPPVASVSSRAAALATQRVGFCHTTDGVRLAYGISGTGPPLVKASNWLTHLDYDWDSPVWRHWWEALSARHTLVRYDERGCGLSDWDVDSASFTLDAWVRDLETVVDALGLQRFPLLGISQGGPIAITYAARHPDRVSHVIVHGTCARATWARADEGQRRELAALGELIKSSWGSERPGFRQIYDAKFLPDGPIELWRAFDELQRRSASARNAHRLWRAFGSLDCSEAASSLTVPTLILHADADQVWSYEEAEDLHARIRGSRLVRLQSNNHILRGDEDAFATFLDEVERFLAG
jgi:pimeloyl-ACP methyl ester carboxylesterase/DNA-binding SARP family transcriptional activator